MKLGAEHGIKAVAAEMTTIAPEWALREFPHARAERRDGSRGSGGMHGSCVTGGIMPNIIKVNWTRRRGSLANLPFAQVVGRLYTFDMDKGP